MESNLKNSDLFRYIIWEKVDKVLIEFYILCKNFIDVY